MKCEGGRCGGVYDFIGKRQHQYVGAFTPRQSTLHDHQ